MESILKIAKSTEKSGFDFVFCGDHFNFLPPGERGYEAWATLTAVASHLDETGVRTAVSWPQARQPGIMAQRLTTIDEIAGGEVILGMGPGEAMNTEPLGIALDQSVSRMEEAIEVMRTLWDGGGSYDGKFYELNEAQLQLPSSRIPVHLGTNSKNTRILTGEIGDGWIPFPETPDLYAEHKKDVDEGISNAGRSESEVTMGLQVMTAISQDEDEIREAVRPHKAVIATPDAAHLREAGYDLDVFGEDIPETWYWTDLLYNDEGVEDWKRVTDAVPDEAMFDFGVMGTVEECIERIEKYREAGVEDLYVINVGPDPQKTREVYQNEIIPYFTDV